MTGLLRAIWWLAVAGVLLTIGVAVTPVVAGLVIWVLTAMFLAYLLGGFWDDLGIRINRFFSSRERSAGDAADRWVRWVPVGSDSEHRVVGGVDKHASGAERRSDGDGLRDNGAGVSVSAVGVAAGQVVSDCGCVWIRGELTDLCWRHGSYTTEDDDGRDNLRECE